MNSKFALIILMLLSACATRTEFAPSISDQKYEVRTPAPKIELFRSQNPIRKFLEIGSVNACCDRDTNALIERLKEEASKNGGDAMIDLDVNAVHGASASVIRYE